MPTLVVWIGRVNGNHSCSSVGMFKVKYRFKTSFFRNVVAFIEDNFEIPITFTYFKSIYNFKNGIKIKDGLIREMNCTRRCVVHLHKNPYAFCEPYAAHTALLIILSCGITPKSLKAIKTIYGWIPQFLLEDFDVGFVGVAGGDAVNVHTRLHPSILTYFIDADARLPPVRFFQYTGTVGSLADQESSLYIEDCRNLWLNSNMVVSRRGRSRSRSISNGEFEEPRRARSRSRSRSASPTKRKRSSPRKRRRSRSRSKSPQRKRSKSPRRRRRSRSRSRSRSR